MAERVEIWQRLTTNELFVSAEKIWIYTAYFDDPKVKEFFVYESY